MATESTEKSPEIKEFEAAVNAALQPIQDKLKTFEEGMGKLEKIEEAVAKHGKHFEKMAKHYAKHFAAIEDEGNPGDDGDADEGNEDGKKPKPSEMAAIESLRKEFSTEFSGLKEGIMKLMSAAGNPGKTLATSTTEATTTGEVKTEKAKNFEAIVRPVRSAFKARKDIEPSKRADAWMNEFQSLCTSNEALYLDYVERQKSGKVESFE